MEDARIIELYWERNESAIAETDRKYGPFCKKLARDILTLKEDAEECVSDTWLKAWHAIPPQKPQYFRAWLGRITRNLALTRWQRQHTQKRYAGMDALLSELEDCIPASDTVEASWEDAELCRILEDWLKSLDETDRNLFLRRYWYAMPVKELARRRGEPAQRTAQRMYRLRLSLKEALQKEGVSL